VDAKNRRDVEAMVASFADDASVRDEGHEYRGRAEIRDWLADVTSRYAVTVAPLSITQADEATVMSAQIAGNFPGSPVALSYRFTLASDRIVRLEIG
jgi:hypothetical protein